MNETTQKNDLDVLNASIAQLRGEIATLAAYLKLPAELIIDKSPVDVERSGFWHKLDEAGARGKAIANNFGEEIRRHPLIGGIAAFCLGFVIARLLFRRSEMD